MQKSNDKGQEYIDAFPKLKKWINVCICCGRKGYKPNTPDKISAYEYSLAGSNIKKYFEPPDSKRV